MSHEDFTENVLVITMSKSVEACYLLTTDDPAPNLGTNNTISFISTLPEKEGSEGYS